jgi:hypothetical protein
VLCRQCFQSKRAPSTPVAASPSAEIISAASQAPQA